MELVAGRSSMSRRVILAPCGSAGDVNPFVALGCALRARGHAVTLMTNAHFAPLAERNELDFVPIGSDEEYTSTLRDPDLWDPIKAFRLLVKRLVAPNVRTLHDAIATRYVPGKTVVAASAMAFGARLARDTLGVPLATVHLQPSMFRSAHRAAVTPGLFMPDWAPKLWKRLLYRVVDRFVFDPVLAPAVNAARAEFGLAPVRRIIEWMTSPDRVIAFFPEWFASPQPDWSPGARLAGFPLFDGAGAFPESVEAFLDDGPPPIVVTAGTAMAHARPFFAAAVEACVRLRRRALLVTAFPDQLPSTLPDGIAHATYVPFSPLLRRTSALVHHGGIGTAAQALAAGVPQLVMPMTFDQPDNAAHLVRLGVAAQLSPKAFRAPAVATALEHLLASPHVAERCRAVASEFRANNDPAREACEVLEQLVVDSRPMRLCRPNYALAIE
jgi:rhamnosyltransferase subunit B